MSRLVFKEESASDRDSASASEDYEAQGDERGRLPANREASVDHEEETSYEELKEKKKKKKSRRGNRKRKNRDADGIEEDQLGEADESPYDFEAVAAGNEEEKDGNSDISSLLILPVAKKVSSWLLTFLQQKRTPSTPEVPGQQSV